MIFKTFRRLPLHPPTAHTTFNIGTSSPQPLVNKLKVKSGEIFLHFSLQNCQIAVPDNISFYMKPMCNIQTPSFWSYHFNKWIELSCICHLWYLWKTRSQLEFTAAICKIPRTSNTDALGGEVGLATNPVSQCLWTREPKALVFKDLGMRLNNQLSYRAHF